MPGSGAMLTTVASSAAVVFGSSLSSVTSKVVLPGLLAATDATLITLPLSAADCSIS